MRRAARSMVCESRWCGRGAATDRHGRPTRHRWAIVPPGNFFLLLVSTREILNIYLLFSHVWYVCGGSLLTGVEASAAQKRPVTKTCLQCGAIQPSNVRVCKFCDSSFPVHSSSGFPTEAYEADSSEHADVTAGAKRAKCREAAVNDEAWKSELSERVQAYRTRRRKGAPNAAQTSLPFEEPRREPTIVRAAAAPVPPASVAIQEASPAAEPTLVRESEDFAFTIAIGRNAATREDSRMVIDVSEPPAADAAIAAMGVAPAAKTEEAGAFPVASIEERRVAGLIDSACLLFAYGAFLTLFGSLGGQFTLSKLSAAVCVATFVIVYLQYFALFTVFGGTTPGMMLRGLQVVNFAGETPSPRQMLWRSVGYMLSAGTLFLGFLWAIWDEDGLTWHDRLSHTYLAAAPTFAEMESRHVAHTR
jgi:uncharacterized RDD family membrane protein YckC